MEVWGLIIGLIAPVYFGCIILLQTYSSLYALWFLSQLDNTAEPTKGDQSSTNKPIGLMETDCKDLVTLFFVNELVVLLLTLI